MRLSARGPGPQAGPAGRLPGQGRGAGARDRRRRPGHADRHAVGGGRQALQRLLRARSRRHRGGALQGRSAQLRGVRREARVRRRAQSRSGELSRRASRPADLRGHLGRRGGRVPGRDRLRAADRAERLALSARQGRRAPQHRGGARHRKRSADRLRQSGRRPGRARVRRRLVRAAFGSLARLPAAGLSRDGPDAALGAHRQRLALRRWPDRQARGERRQGRLRGLHAGAARLRQQERLQGRRAGPLGRHRFRAGGGAVGRCAGSRARALRDAALPLHLAGLARRCRRASPRRSACRLRRGADRERGARARAGACAAVQGPAARRHRGEPAGARARHHPDGDLQQARPDGGDDRQQVGNVGRLRHALRRHERRLQPDQGPLQDRGLSAGAAAQRLEARGRARPGRERDPRAHHHPRADRGAAREPDRPGLAAAL